MRNLLIINGHDYYERAQGQLNNTMVKHITELTPKEYEVIHTDIIKGYHVNEEIQKFKWADVVIIQAPIYWFSLPGILKKYIDDVFVPGVFFGKAKKFGTGGKFNEKEYMLSVTWGARESAFNGMKDDFLEGLSEDQVLLSIHKTFEYCGFNKLPTFSIYSSMNLAELDSYITKLKHHLQEHLFNSFE
ncbi:NAD(P)H-dependent oxidoreductase [Alkalihalophilus pseudofirmus]|uniref:NAD(P)H-dependent oxidoreductase n=1 Tax=Alkalihalophilus pseudofirmus TaxID=79885 RepID=A0AAJ2NMQ1_ALKPS|nr:NAD(P)H-dependent oxidoreductase [Alkalihalophilus pseudofirmus]MDV2884630.1 NAD(P)H-dependent oxidoreductase [Alkalihalophilus pseudofirmus]